MLGISGWWFVVGGWWLVVGGWWLVVGGWWLVIGHWSGNACISDWIDPDNFHCLLFINLKFYTTFNHMKSGCS
jgi:hypothetical protein